MVWTSQKHKILRDGKSTQNNYKKKYLNDPDNHKGVITYLENPRDRGAWLAAIYGVAQSWTRLKRLSSSSSRGKDKGKTQGVWDQHVHTAIFKMDLMYNTGNSSQSYVADWMEGEFGGERIHACVWLSPFAVHLKLSQHC